VRATSARHPSKIDPKSTEEQLVPAANVAELHLARALVVNVGRARPGASGAWDVPLVQVCVRMVLITSLPDPLTDDRAPQALASFVPSGIEEMTL
jgi:hypothetical protein